MYYIVSLILPDAKALLQAGTVLFVALKGSILNNLPGTAVPLAKSTIPSFAALAVPLTKLMKCCSTRQILFYIIYPIDFIINSAHLNVPLEDIVLGTLQVSLFALLAHSVLKQYPLGRIRCACAIKKLVYRDLFLLNDAAIICQN